MSNNKLQVTKETKDSRLRLSNNKSGNNQNVKTETKAPALKGTDSKRK